MAEALNADKLTVPHGFFTRRGGVSTGPFTSLNCSLSGQDDPAAVLENRTRVAHVIQAKPSQLLGLNQVHGIGVVTVTEPWTPEQRPKADAMVTARPDIALGVVTADCAPVLFVDAERNIVGAAHAGWRGAVAGILEATVAAMMALGSVSGRIAVAIGPCIAQPSYEVGPDLRDAVVARCLSDAMFFSPGVRFGHWQFDLAEYCAARLRAAGVSTIMVTGYDTLADEARFFSHRRRTLAQRGGIAAPIGHQISVIRPG
ncbi:peptidoglycan editing factor PgeF [Rhodopila sp.]|uniref:peptidoglycan editing factor PgeF n=1 Tax=Rhodopila sp. TaxID=2480087 RepID=UPI003D0AB5B7